MAHFTDLDGVAGGELEGPVVMGGSTLSRSSNAVLCVTTMHGGPKHGRKFEVPRTVGFLNDEGGHYARIPGGLNTEMYWHNFRCPMAVRSGWNLKPVMTYNAQIERLASEKPNEETKP